MFSEEVTTLQACEGGGVVVAAVVVVVVHVLVYSCKVCKSRIEKKMEKKVKCTPSSVSPPSCIESLFKKC